MWEMEKELRKSPYKDIRKWGRILFSNVGPGAKMLDRCIDSGLRFVIWVEMEATQGQGVEEFAREPL